MLKKIALVSLAVIILAYLLFAVTFMNKQVGNGVCKNLLVDVVDTLDMHYIEGKTIALKLKNAGINPIGEELSKINSGKIEEVLEKDELIRKAECFKTVDGNLRVKVYQKTPVLRIISTSGNYYVDNEGQTMPVPPLFSAYVPIVTGHVEKKFAQNELFKFALFLQNDKFWNSQIEQIYVSPNLDIELTPRVGNHQIILGKIEDYKENLDKLRLFYEQGLNQVGWNKYSVINLKFKNQVVCTKKRL